MENKNMVVMKTLKLKLKALLLLAMLLTGGVASAQVVVKGSVYGGGQGIKTDTKSGLVTGNATVTMNGGTVQRSIYGGGELGSVGTFIDSTKVVYDGGTTVYVPKTCATNTGLTKVIVNGGNVGLSKRTKMPVADNTYGDDFGYIFGAGRGEGDSITRPLAVALAVSGSAVTEINGTTTFIHGSVYGGSENGLVLGNTRVAISGGQIGDGYYKDEHGHEHWDSLYTEEQWATVIDKIKDGSFTADDAADFHECDHWPYQSPYQPYDPYILEGDVPKPGSNGYTTYGNVFGGGSGYYPIKQNVWRRTAGQVRGNSEVIVTGGHILTSIYGGNEMTDVLGTSKVTMTGGTLGVPRSLDSIAAHPVTCYLFGGGKGDQRTAFNTWTNVQNAEVNIGGNAFFFGSVFGGGEDGHVLGDVTVNINNLASGANNAYIGTWGYSYVDGNVFGGGRGFSGDALTAGSVGGNVTLNIGGGTMLGSVYGGGRLASVGTPFTLPTDPNYGQMQAGDDHGIVRVNITGGTIGNDYESKLHHSDDTKGGNVYGGSMGRLTLLDGITLNPLWPNLGKVKNTYVTIKEINPSIPTIIKGKVYGGSEMGTLSSNAEDLEEGIASGNATVTIEGGTIWRDVYGGSLGSSDTKLLAPLYVHGSQQVQVNPMQRAGRIDGNTSVNIAGGWVKKCVYGGGELASVGTITEKPAIHAETGDDVHPFNISWPYEFKYADGTGTCTVNVTGGRIGLTGKDFMGPWNAAGVPLIKLEGSDNYVAYNAETEGHTAALKAACEDNGDVYGGGKGIAGDRYVFADCANANNTVVTIGYSANNVATPENYMPSDWVYGFYPTATDWSDYTAANMGCISGALYGGGENGHVNTDASVTLNNGLVGHNLYGGGKGSDKYEVTLLNPETHQPYQTLITSITAGKVFGNTYVNMNGGYVVRNVFGGGNQASVGKGNYASGPDDFTPDGYGEQWTAADNDDEMQALFYNSGHTYVNIYGGTVGTVNGMKDGIPTGNVFGSSRGTPAPNVPQTLTPRILYYPEFFLGYTNHTHVVIGKEENNDGPRVYGSVFGGGQDGHVRWDANVIVNKGEIGNKYDPTVFVESSNTTLFDLVGDDLTSYQWRGRGSVYGAGAGLGMYTDATGSHFSTSAGSVTQFTTVTINGGTIHQNVYGGGPLSSVGPPAMGQNAVPSREYSLAQVNIYSAIGDEDVVIATENNPASAGGQYGGSVFGAGRGVFDFTTDPSLTYDKFATSMFSEVNLYDGAYVPGDVFGGGQLGQVRNDTKVNMKGGTVGTIAYRHKKYTDTNAALDSIVHTSGGRVFGGGAGYPVNRDAALVKGNTEINISGGHVLFNVYGGGEMASVGLREQYTYTTGEGNEQTEHTDYRPKLDDYNKPTGLAKVNVTGGQVGPAPGTGTYNGQPYNVAIGLDGVDGYVFGGGKGIANDYITDPAHPYSGRFNDLADVNNTEVTVNIPASANANTNRIWGSIFGGAEDGHVLGDAHTYYVSGLMGTTGTTSYDGNIFGGGRNFSKANYNAGRVRGNITVEMSGGQIYGSIFGGGRLALTGVDLYGNIIPDEEGENGQKFGNVKVKVTGGKVGNEALIKSFTTYSMGDVFGGGKGDKTGVVAAPGVYHPKASVLLVSMVKNTVVEISEANPDVPTRIYGSVYGGGEMANVGQYTWDLVPGQEPKNITLKDGTGVAKVTVSGGIIGIDNMSLSSNDIHVDANFNPTMNIDIGHVFGAGEGIVDDPDRLDDNGQPLYPQVSIVEGGQTISLSLFNLMNTVGETQVTISGDAFVKGSVYGGGLNGHVERDAKVYIQGGQIGFGENADGTDKSKYDNVLFVNPLQEGGITTSLAGCPHWDLGNASGTIIPYDPVWISQGIPPRDGTSWYGNVYGGGSGLLPYVAKNTSNNQWESHWNSYSGQVKGNTRVEISGGHILTNVYGGCEITNVGSYGYDNTQGVTNISGEGKGKATIVMSGGSIGVPRTAEQIEQFPLSGDLFGAGKGDPRTAFNTWTNVANTDITITGGFVYGSVFGGGEDGHVIENAKILVSKAEGSDLVIGSHGNTGLEGNVFGGGQGDVPEALTAGGLGGNTLVEVEDGNILGSVYGGGSTGSVGIRFVPAGHQQYGLVQDGENHGYTTVNISGGTIGHVDNTGRIGGNVYGGCRGIAGPEGSTFQSMAKVKETHVNISQANGKQTFIMGSVFGAGEDGHVTKDTHVAIAGGQIGGDRYYAGDATPHLCANEFHGNVYGGGRGLDTYTDTSGQQQYSITAGKVDGNTNVSITGGRVCRDVYGGGNISSVGDPNEMPDAQGNYHTGLATVIVSGGKIGIGSGEYDNDYASGHVFGSGHGKAGTLYADKSFVKNTFVNIKENAIVYGSVFGSGEDGHVRKNTHVLVEGGTIGVTGDTGYEGNVYGGGRGIDEDAQGNLSPSAGKTEGNTLVEVVGGWVKGSVFGGGRLASVGNPAEEPDAQGNYHTGLAEVVIGDGMGTKTAIVGTTHEAQTPVIYGGNVYGGGKGQAGATYRDLTFVKNTSVTIRKGAAVHGSVFGGGEDGHVRQTSTVNVTGGTIGDDESICENKYHGNVYGAGRGIDNTGQGEGGYSWTAGRVNWSATVNISGGRIYRNVYGGGNLASVGRVKRNESFVPVLLPNGDMNPLDQNDQPMFNADGSENSDFDSDLLTGWAHVNITGGTIGSDADIDDFHGNVFGSSHGMAGEDFKNLAYVHNAEVRVSEADSENPTLIKGSVFGGGEDGHVTLNTKVTVNGGQIGAKDNDEYKGNVYGGGRGIDIDSEGQLSSTAGMVKGHTRVYVNGGLVKNSVYGGGNKSVVRAEKVVNINDGTVEQDVYGGCNAVPEGRQHIGLKTVNVRNGLIKGNVYGCSHNSTDGNAEVTPTTDNPSWTAFVNISGGVIGGNANEGNVHGAGFEGIVNGSVCVNVGKDAIVKQVNNVNQPRIAANTFYNDCGGDEPGLTSGQTAIEPTVGKLIIRGSVFGGSDYFGSTQSTNWNNFDITGYSNLYVDGTGYNTSADDEATPNYMAIGGGLFGSGTHCESGKKGRHILLKDYGTRNAGDELTQATRTLTTIQRGNTVLLDNANVNLIGADDISGRADATKDYGVMKVDDGLLVTNATGIVLGAANAPAYMDSIKQVRSLHLKAGTSYENMNANGNWEWIGIKGDSPETAQLYYTETNPNTALASNDENVIIFNDISKLWVRYTQGTTNFYGELQGFFRMRGDSYQPRGMESFAYARPKITDGSTDEDNKADGGFLSYNNSYNFFTDNGETFTKTMQHPYTNVIEMAKIDRVEYRMWVIPALKQWYVDGRETDGIGQDNMDRGRGLFPDRPKKTITAAKGIYDGANTLEGTPVEFDQEEDAIYVVGHVNSKFETGFTDDKNLNKYADKPLRLYRYPGGHPLSSATATDPGANYESMLLAESDRPLTLNNVLIDGLYGFGEEDAEAHAINDGFVQTNVEKPMVVTQPHATLTLNGGTVLMRGYNNTDAATTWYYDADYSCYAESTQGGETVVNTTHQGGAMFVDSLASVNVSGLVTITGNKQKFGNDVVNSNVYLPAFSTYMNIGGELDATTAIGVTSPKRSKKATYEYNTLSPVAVAAVDDNAMKWAKDAWKHCNFLDDQEWFFVNGHRAPDSLRTTYYNGNISKGTQVNTLYFGWTWANVVRKAPDGFADTNIDSAEDLAWLISQSTGMNGATATNFADADIRQTSDIDLKQYVWVPIGEKGEGLNPFAGHYDGQGHLISNLFIDYIGKGDKRYERENYGLFGYVNGGMVNRTFVVSGTLKPLSSRPLTLGEDEQSSVEVNIGGLVGRLEGSAVVSNSEAAVRIDCPNQTNAYKVVAGGLVAQMGEGTTIHSSMAMPVLAVQPKTQGWAGGLVGQADGGQVHNSFVNSKIGASGNENKVKMGGLIGHNIGASMSNCYVNLYDFDGISSSSSEEPSANFGGIVAKNDVAANIDSCYVMQNTTNLMFNDALDGAVQTSCSRFSPVVGADNLGYMYADNVVTTSKGDTTMCALLNKWAKWHNRTELQYAYWSRPGLSEINGDLPTLMLCDGTDHQGEFRSLATHEKGKALQYGGTVRDGENKQLSTMLGRGEYVFVYGDIDGGADADAELATATIQADKVSIYEHASIKHPGALTGFGETYVGVTFDNSCGHATSTPGVNYGLIGMGGYLLPRDWHMFSTPLSNAPMGFNYMSNGTNTNTEAYSGGDHGLYYNNPWASTSSEFSWLTQAGSDECAPEASYRYWMNEQDDGYFPTHRGSLFDGHVNDLFIVGGVSDECPEENMYRYPYGMDFYAWTEPDYHWINFKRNGPNHWHSDEPHVHLDYVTEVATNHSNPQTNVNEKDMISGKGYMAAITTETFMQSHGNLNGNEQSINLTKTAASKLPGWNLVGNPFHGYLDFDLLAKGENLDVLSDEYYGNPDENKVFYVVYDADKYTNGDASTAFRYYPVNGSKGGDYAERFLHPHQGFYVKAKNAGALKFDENMLVDRKYIAAQNEESHLRDERPAYPLVNLYLSSDKGCADVTVIEFERPEWGGATKLKELRVGDGVFYAQHDDTHFAALFAQQGVERVPLWFEAKDDDIFTIKWNTANGNFHSMYLIDNKAGVQYDMLRNDTYTFEGHKGDYPSRFYIVFNVTDVPEHTEDDSFVFFDGSQWVVTGEGDLEFIDLQGQVLWKSQVHGGQSRVSVPVVACGMYMFRLINGKETKVQKVVVNRFSKEGR